MHICSLKPVTESTAGVLGALALGTDLAHDAILGTTREIHRAVTKRVRRVTDLVGGHRSEVNALHGGVAGAVYGGIGLGLRGVTAGLRAADPYVGARLEDSPRGQFVASALNGIFGDRVVERHPTLAVPTSLRVRGADVTPDRPGLAAAYGETPSGDLVVFVHGLSENESYWDRRPKDPESDPRSYGARLAERGWQPLMVRLNSGLAIRENGVAVASLLDQVVANWPVPVRRIALVGHSMGGLILRSACAVLTDTDPDTAWNRLVTDVITLGTPHLGAPIARALFAGSKGLALLPESAPIGAFLDHRAVGINDLRRGLPPDVRHLPHARYRLVAATLGPTPTHPLSLAAGDLLVGYASALGRERGRELFPGASTLYVPDAGHFDLLNHADVYAALEGWLSEPR